MNSNMFGIGLLMMGLGITFVVLGAVLLSGSGNVVNYVTIGAGVFVFINGIIMIAMGMEEF